MITRRTLAAALLATPSWAQTKNQPKRHPNVIFMLTDDQRWDQMSCAGHPVLKTPNMDRIAREGLMFHNAFVVNSLCSPRVPASSPAATPTPTESAIIKPISPKRK